MIATDFFLDLRLRLECLDFSLWNCTEAARLALKRYHSTIFAGYGSLAVPSWTRTLLVGLSQTAAATIQVVLVSECPSLLGEIRQVRHHHLFSADFVSLVSCHRIGGRIFLQERPLALPMPAYIYFHSWIEFMSRLNVAMASTMSTTPCETCVTSRTPKICLSMNCVEIGGVLLYVCRHAGGVGTQWEVRMRCEETERENVRAVLGL